VRLVAAAALACGMAAVAVAAEGTYTVKALAPEAALKAAQAALAKCRAEGFQVSVTVVDRSAIPLVLLRDRYASAFSVDMAQRKAQTAVNFRMDTSTLDRETQPGRPSAELRRQPNVAAVAGGVVIEAGGSLVGAIGVSGAPGGANDELCAREGVKAIAEDLEL
jgi:uncharacterized protein GlcG (DUF336 family)